MVSQATSSPASFSNGQGRGGFDAPVRDVMTSGVVTISEDASLREVQRAMVDHRVDALLVVGRTTAVPVGWVTARGLLAWVGRDPAISRARDAITERPLRIDPNASALEATIALSAPGTSHLLVCRHGEIAVQGVVSATELVALGLG